MTTAPEAEKAGGFSVRTGITADACDQCSEPVHQDQRALTNGQTTRHADCATKTYATHVNRRKDRVGTINRGKHGRQTRRGSRKQYRRRKN